MTQSQSGSFFEFFPVYIYICTYVHIHIHTYTHIHMHTYTCKKKEEQLLLIFSYRNKILHLAQGIYIVNICTQHAFNPCIAFCFASIYFVEFIDGKAKTPVTSSKNSRTPRESCPQQRQTTHQKK